MKIYSPTKEQKQAFFNVGFDPNASGTCYLVTWLNGKPKYIYRESNSQGKPEVYKDYQETIGMVDKKVNVTGTLVNTIEFCVFCYKSDESCIPYLAVSYGIVHNSDHTFTVVRNSPIRNTRNFAGNYKTYELAKESIFEKTSRI